ncbi:F-box/kelch-repeat protein [Senna tora]|uniref:F-box/kelch-repeat protein n=1 Tax=Senna tora TaxID=362788 RepID=A0A834XE03_9FABA|nr:F-box/kelch-repeat protein [Senna tora]
MMDLISGLPDDVALECLIRVSYDQFPVVASVSKCWKTEIEMPEFRRRRRTTGHTQRLVVMVQARVDSEKRSSDLTTKGSNSMNPVYRLSVYEPGTGQWSELPPPPGFTGGLPMFCQIAGVGYDLVLMGGWDPDTWKSSNSVFIYNFLSAKWRRGADMPGGPRTFFACASDSERVVYVAGGHDDEKNALRSALAYDVARDEWVPLPDMEKERDECKAIFHSGSGKFCVIGGYCTQMQGRFEKSAEVFDVATWKWDPVEDQFLGSATCPRTCVDGGDDSDGGRFYMCRGGDVVVLQGSTWQEIAKVPSEIREVAYVRAWEGTLLLIGSSGFAEPCMGFLLDLKSNSWTKLESPMGFTGCVQSGCLLEI